MGNTEFSTLEEMEEFSFRISELMDHNKIGPERSSLFLLGALRTDLLNKHPQMDWDEFCDRLKDTALKNHL